MSEDKVASPAKPSLSEDNKGREMCSPRKIKILLRKNSNEAANSIENIQNTIAKENKESLSHDEDETSEVNGTSKSESNRETSSKKTILRSAATAESKLERINHKLNHISALKSVVGREAEYKVIERQVQSFIDSNVGSVLYITGVPGSGKTYTTVSLLKSLKIDFVYINCSSLKSKNEIFEEIKSCTPCCKNTSPKLSSLRLHFMNCNKKHVLIIDEVDFLITKNEKILYNLFELPFLDNASLMIIVISNTLGTLSSKTESRVGKNRLEFRPYDSNQLKNVILSQYNQSQVDEKSLDLIVKKVASSTGDIRKVKDFVESSGNLGISKIAAILKSASNPLLMKFVYTFNFYQKLVLHLNRKPKSELNEWFQNFRSFCLAKNIQPLDYCDFLYVVHDLVNFGIYSIKNDETTVICHFLDEEIEHASKQDKDFLQFKSTKI